jgi:tetratricopeptide (TPR) repeat protein
MTPLSRPILWVGGGLLALALAGILSPARSWWRAEITRYRLAPLLAELADSRSAGDWQAALEAAQKGLEIAPARDDIRLEKLLILYEHQKYPAALLAATGISGTSPHYPESRFIIGLIAFERGETDKARALLEQSADDVRLPPAERRKARRLTGRIGLSQAYIAVAAHQRPRYAEQPPVLAPLAVASVAPSAPPAILLQPEPAMDAAFRALNDGRTEDALTALSRAETEGAGPVVHLYQGYALLKLGRPDEAETQFLAAAAADQLDAGSRAAAWTQAGYLAVARQDHAAAITRFQHSIALVPPGRALLLQLGYAQAAALQWQDAVRTLQQAEAMGDASPQLFQDIAYAARHAGAPGVAAHWFRRALDNGETLDRDRRLALKQEVEWLEDRFDVSLYSAFRGNAVNTATLNPLERSVLQSQGGLGLRYIPPGMGREVGRFAALTGRLLWSYDKGSLDIPSASWQGGLGGSLRPLPFDNLVIGAERLIAIGRDARNDWLVRAGYSWSHMANASSWPDATLYLDAALIDPASPDILATGDFRLGKRIVFRPWLRLWPHLVLAGNWQDDDYGSVSLLEAGPGLTATLNFDEGHYRAYRASLDISLQYRLKLAGSSVGRSGPLLTISLQR